MSVGHPSVTFRVYVSWQCPKMEKRFGFESLEEPACELGSSSQRAVRATSGAQEKMW